MSEVWIVIVEDRHSDVDALPFSTQEQAAGYARDWVRDAPEFTGDAEDAELNDAMRRDGWVLYLPYGSEGARVRVVKRAMDDTGKLR